MSYFRTLLIGAVALSTIPWIIPLSMAADNQMQTHPGFVDFSTLTAQVESEPTVEISLKAPLLAIITNLIRSEDEMAADFVSRLINVRVNVFQSNALDVDNISTSMSEIASDLDNQGWDRVVRVREDDEYVDIYLRLSKDAELIHGIAVMVASDEETVMINIVGDISGNDIAALGRRFDIDELMDMDDLSTLEVEAN
ncbi:MAG: DUF4252 domain-containing protein [Gammaproteobacteria bacterium]|nr:DUF4252 domain-containing protein [Gammaproteobacteria bacterium]